MEKLVACSSPLVVPWRLKAESGQLKASPVSVSLLSKLIKPSLLLIGLGNPGSQYDRTRHNVGFQALDVLAEQYGEGEWQDKPKFKSHILEGRIGVMPVMLVKPQTYMNLSGESAQKIVDYYKMDPAKQIVVLCDDVDLPLGDLRYREKGSAGTHNGLKSLVEIFGEDFPRLRIGLGKPQRGEDLANWVLSIPPKEELDALADACEGVQNLLEKEVCG